MGGIGAHCFEDYETLKIFVEAPSTYKDDGGGLTRFFPVSGLVSCWMYDDGCLASWRG